MSTLSGKQLPLKTALAILALLVAFQGTALAARLAGNDPGLVQNLALAHELQNRFL